MSSWNKNINELIPDIYKYLGGLDDTGRRTLVRDISAHCHSSVEAQLAKPPKDRPTLRLSQMGPRCPRALWYSIHHPELAVPLEPWAMVKFTFGDIIESIPLVLARRVGHEVTGEQSEVWVDGIRGTRDCIIDGCVVDIKSASSRSFQKFKDGSIKANDPFGYLDQLDGYLVGSADDELVRNKTSAYLLAVDKTLGHMVLYEHTGREQSIRERIARYKIIVGASTAPACSCKSVPDGKSGNYKLDITGSYSSYKFCCNPRVRTFLYSDGPRFLTKVVRKPDVPEIDRSGRIVYH